MPSGINKQNKEAANQKRINKAALPYIESPSGVKRAIMKAANK